MLVNDSTSISPNVLYLKIILFLNNTIIKCNNGRLGIHSDSSPVIDFPAHFLRAKMAAPPLLLRAYDNRANNGRPYIWLVSFGNQSIRIIARLLPLRHNDNLYCRLTRAVVVITII